jgi:putative endopeptidase
LQAPYFDPSADLAINYGGVGALIGHEMTHGFRRRNPENRRLGSNSGLVERQGAKIFETRAAMLGSQFAAFKPLSGLHIARCEAHGRGPSMGQKSWSVA